MKFLHAFTSIKSCEKWTEVRLNLGKKDTYNPDEPATAAADGCPDGNKKAKAARAGAPAAERLQSSIERCLVDAKTHAIQRKEKCDARWSMLLEKQDIKIDLLKTTVATKKRNTDLAFLVGGNPTLMDDQVKA